MATFSQSLLAKGSDLVQDFCCLPCLEQNIVEWAEFYCDRCLKFYCGKCISLHDQLFVKHVTHGRCDTSKWPISKEIEDFLQKCDLHEDKCLEMYCDDHSELCCTNCAFLNHRQCAKVTMISELVKGPPPDFPQLSEKIQSILETLKKLQNNWKTNMQDLETSYIKQLHEIRETRQEMITILDEMEKICMNERDDKMTSLNASLKTDLDNSSILQNELQRFSEAIHDTVDKGKAELAYIASKKASVTIQRSEIYLKEKYVEVNSIVTFQANSDVQQFLSKLSGLARIVLSKRGFAGLDSPEQVFTLKGMSTLREVLEDAEREESECQIVLRSKYTVDQLTTLNPEDTKLYDQDFPLQFQRESTADIKQTDLLDIVLHKAEKAWKPSHLMPMKDTDVDEATELYKKIRSIFNRLTPKNFKVLLSQMNGLKIDTESKLKGVIDIVFEKAIRESNFTVSYAKMCRCLSILSVQSDSNPNEKVSFREVLLTRCQREFEKEKSSEAGVVTNLVTVEQFDNSSKTIELKQTLEPQESKSKHRPMGYFRFMSELFKLKMISINRIHDCLYKLLRNRDIECVCVVLSTIGKKLDYDRSRPRMDQYFAHMDKIVNDKKTPSNARFMLQDVIDLRRNNWIPRRIPNSYS